jgi:hypothetical protein
VNELQIKKLVAVMVAAYPSSKISEESVGVYTRMLADLDYPAANAAVEQLLATSKWMPTVAEIRDRIVSLVTGEIRAGGEAWGSVLKAIRGAGRYRIPGVDFAFFDPVTAECVSAMSWVELCDSENPTADRARFIELYDQLATRHRRAQLSEGLPAMQRFRALQAANDGAKQPARISAGDGDARTFGQILKFVAPSGGDS